jgi:hypothetical protein
MLCQTLPHHPHRTCFAIVRLSARQHQCLSAVRSAPGTWPAATKLCGVVPPRRSALGLIQILSHAAQQDWSSIVPNTACNRVHGCNREIAVHHFRVETSLMYLRTCVLVSNRAHPTVEAQATQRSMPRACCVSVAHAFQLGIMVQLGGGLVVQSRRMLSRKEGGAAHDA